jgi:hypothetical protein
MTRFVVAFTAIFSLHLGLHAQSLNSRGRGVVLVNPTPAQERSLPPLTARNAYGSIQAALSAQPIGPTLVYLSCGTYSENIVISTPDVKIAGEERGCVQLQPADPSLPVVSIDATNTSGIDFDEVSDLTISCPTGLSCSDGLKITGRTDIAQRNDFHKFSRIGVYGAFQNGVNLAGRTIWTEFDNVEVGFTRGNGINIVSNATTNELTFRNVRSAENYNYGIYVNNTQPDLANGILFDKVNAEYNGLNTNLANCAGISLTGIGQANITNSYFEGNCQGNTTHTPAAEVRLTGTYNESVNITNSVFNLQYTEGGIYNDSILTTGTYEGNKFDTSGGTATGGNNFTIYVATSHPISNVVIGENFNSTPTIIPDIAAITHVRTLSPFGLNYTAITSVQGNSIDVSRTSGLILYSGPYTINNFVNGVIGQIIYVTAFNLSGHVLTNRGGGTGEIIFPDGLDRTLNAGESLLLYYDGNHWRPIESTITSQVRFVTTITTTAAALDNATVAGLTTGAHCNYSATNDIAASMSGIYIVANDGSVSLHHAAVQGGTFNVFCSSN